MTIVDVPEIDVLVTKLSEKFKLECANPKNVPGLYLKETTELIRDAPFLAHEPAYLYLLCNYGDIMLFTNNFSIGFFGFGYWDGTAIRDYPLVDKNGMFVFADLANSAGNLILFAFNSKTDDNKIYYSTDAEIPFKITSLNFMTLLEQMLKDECEFI